MFVGRIRRHIHTGAAHLNDRRDLGVDVVVAEVESSPEGAFVQQRVLVELNLATRVPLVQANGAVRKVDHLPEDQLRSCKRRAKLRESGAEDSPEIPRRNLQAEQLCAM